MIEPFVKTTQDVAEKEDNVTLPTQTKLGPPRDETLKRTKAEGSSIDLCIQHRGREYIDLFVHLHGLSIAHRLTQKLREHVQYNFAALDVEELNLLVTQGVRVHTVRSRKLMAGLYWHEYDYNEIDKAAIYKTVNEIHRAFGR